LSSTAEAALIYTLLSELSSKFKLELDSEPVLSRELTISPNLPKTSSEIPALFIGGSNADRLANAAANVGVVPDTVTEGGWVLNTNNVTTALPQIEAYCLTMPAEAPVIIYCLDNSSFCQADGDGVITQIVKLAADNKFHVVGELIVAHEITMAAAVANLKRILAVCGDRQVYIITPLLRYINEACCRIASHCTHRGVPDSATKLLMDLSRLHRFIESRLSSFPKCEVIPAGDLLAAKHGASAAEVLSAYSGWGAVHGTVAAYTRMALTLVDKVLTGAFKKPLPPPQSMDNSGKRKRSESGSSSSSGNYGTSAGSSRRNDSNNLPGFTRGGSRGGGRGSSRGSYPLSFSKGGDSRHFKQDNRYSGGGRKSGSGSGSGGRQDSRYSSGGGSGYYSRY
jgi:hypothetical protein